MPLPRHGLVMKANASRATLKACTLAQAAQQNTMAEPHSASRNILQRLIPNWKPATQAQPPAVVAEAKRKLSTPEIAVGAAKAPRLQGDRGRPANPAASSAGSLLGIIGSPPWLSAGSSAVFRCSGWTGHPTHTATQPQISPRERRICAHSSC